MTNIAKHFQISNQKVRNILTNNNIEIKRRRLVNINLKEDYFSKIDTEEKAYILGILFTDGSIQLDSTRQPSVRLELQIKDIDTIEKIRSELGISSKLIFSKHKNSSGSISESVLLTVRSEKIVNDLAKYNIIPNKTKLIKHLPQNIPFQFQKDFLRGLIDGDGSIYKTSSVNKGRRYFKNVIYFCSHYQSTCEDFKKMIDNVLGYKTQTNITKEKGVYRVSYFKQKYTKDIATLLYKDNNISLQRKYELAKHIYENSEEDIIYSDQLNWC